MENPNHFPSQVEGSMDTPSLSSEPPNVGDWFASYKYESPLLGTIDGFRDSVSGEGEVFVIQANQKEKQMGEFEKNRCKEETKANTNLFIQENRSISEIPDSSYSPSRVSEPPDIRNWFSSYVYESFVLDTNDDVEDTLSQESECDEEGLRMGERQVEQEENMATFREIRNCSQMDAGQEICSNGFVKSDISLRDEEPDDKSLKSSSKVLNSADSLPVFTEPPDVKNWFSSYAYESPALGTNDQFEDSLHLERELDNFVVEDSDGEKEEELAIIRKVRSRDEKVDKQEKLFKSIDGIGDKESLSSQNKCSVKIFKESLECRTLKSSDTSPSKDVEESNFNDEVSASELKQEVSKDGRSLTSNVNESSTNNRNKSPMKLFHRTALPQESMEDFNHVSPTSNGKLAPVSGASPRKQTHGTNDKENEQKVITENAFVATKKNPSTRTENKDSLKMQQGILLECPGSKGTVSSAGEKNVTVRRKALMETTNYQNSDALEVTGKWRCPQRSKPNLGPPLKQLRLERWIHRVQ